MTIEIPYNAHFELSPAGHVALARSCGDGWWEEWVCVRNGEWRRFAELLLDGRAYGCGKQHARAAGNGERSKATS